MPSDTIFNAIEFQLAEDKAEQGGYNLADIPSDVGNFLGTAAIATVNGFYNTGLSIANLGLSSEDEIEYADNKEWIANVLGGKSVEFYEDNKDLVDVASFIGGSLVPGGLAIKGFRAVQPAMQKGLNAFSKGHSGIYSNLSTGLKKVVTPKKEFQKLADDIKYSPNRTFTFQDKVKLAKESTIQNMLEAGIFEIATLATMNKHSMLETEDLNYFESIAKNMDSVLFGTLLGGGIGGIASYASKHASAKKLFKEAALLNNPLVITSSKSTAASLFGDKLVDSVNSIADQKNKIDLLDKKIQQAPAENLSAAQIGLLKGQKELAKKSLTQVKLKLMNEMGEGIDNPIIRGRAAEIFSELEPEEVANIAAGLDSITPLAAVGNLKDPVQDLALNWSGLKELDTGIAFSTKKKLLEIPKQTLKEMDNDEILQVFDSAYTTLKADNVLNRFEGTKLFDDMKVEMNRFNNVEMIDDLKQLNDLRGLVSKASDDTLPELAEKLEQAEALYRYKTDPKNTLGKLFKIINDPAADLNKLKKDYPTVIEAFTKSKGMRTTFGPTEAIFDTINKTVIRESAVVPHAADLGNIKVRGGSIQIEGTNFSYDYAEVKDIFKMNPVEASARYAVAEQNPAGYLKGFIGGAGKPLETFDFPRISAAVRYLREHNRVGAKPVSFKYKNHKGETVKISTVSELLTAVTPAKRLGVMELQKQGKYHQNQIADILDVDSNWVVGEHATTKDLTPEIVFPSLQKSDYYTAPRYMKLNYSRDFRSEAEITGSLNAEQRLIQDYQENQLAAAQHFKDDFKSLDTDGAVSGISGADQGVGFVTANQAAYDQSFIKGAGALLSTRKIKFTDEVNKVYRVEGTAAARNPETVAELNVVNNMSRQGRYYFFDSVDDMFQKEVTSGKYPELMKILAMEPNQQVNLIAAINSAMPQNFRSASLVHQEVFGGVRKTLENLDAAVKLENGSVTAESYAALSSIMQDIPTYLKSSNVTALGKLAHYQVKNKDTVNFMRKFVEENNKTIRSRRTLAKRQGNNISFEENSYYSGALDTTLYNHVNFVKFTDESKVYGSKNMGVVVANTEADLAKKVAALQKSMGDKISIISKESVEDYKKAQEIYDADFAITDNVVDSTIANRGVLWDVMPEYNDNIVQEMINSQVRSKVNLDRGYMALAMEKQISQLKLMEKVYIPKNAIDQSKNRAATGPWGQAINTMLNIPQAGKHEWYLGAQNMVSDAIGKAYSTVKTLSRSIDDKSTVEEFERINKYLEATGLPQPYNQVEDYIKLNSNVSSTDLSGFVSKLNQAASTIMLRLDQTQAIVNAVSMPIMLFPEMARLKNYIKEENLGKLKNMTTTKLAEGLEEPTNMKLFWGAAQEFASGKIGRDESVLKVIDEMTDQGIIGTTLRDFQEAADSFTLSYKVDESFVGNAVKKGVNFLAKPADFSEEFVKFTAARSAQKILELTDLPEKAKWAIVRNFVDKVHGNYVSSQRPTLFKGFAGQAIGLFQTYQFNLYQRLFSHLGEDGKKAAYKMIATQAGIFGAQSLPGFQLLNDHIASKSEDYGNIYSGAKNALGDELSEWIIYGTGSNITKPIPGLGGIDLYSRGDLTPRTPILIPTSFEEIPAYSMTKKAITSFGNAMSKSVAAISGGEPEALGTIMLEALAHNGLNRPLAGVSQLALGYRTTNQGKLISTYDDDDNYLWTAATKAIGAKTLDEGIAVNQYYRAMKYKTARMEKLESLGQSFKDIVRSNDGNLSGEIYGTFLEDYTANGGNYESFKGWTQNQLTGATESVVTGLKNKNNTPEGRYLQNVLGGSEEY